MSSIKESIDVEVPLRAAYDQWTQFESFPQFMSGVQSVQQVSDTRNLWLVEIAGIRREFVTEIAEQRPDERIAWTTVGGDVGHAGVVTFHRLDDELTRVNLEIDVDTERFIDALGDKLGFMSRQVKGDMERFKTFIESRGSASGGWRGNVVHP